jgi:hypothetical protein
VRQADVLDRQTLEVWEWWQARRHQRDTLRDGFRWGWTGLQLGAAWGITSRQGARDMLDRLDALLSGQRPDEKLAREERRRQRRDLHAADPRADWLARHHTAMNDTADAMLSAATALEVADREWLDELAIDREEGWTPASVTVLRESIAEVRTSRGFIVLPIGGPMEQLLVRADRLVGEFVGLG